MNYSDFRKRSRFNSGFRDGSSDYLRVGTTFRPGGLLTPTRPSTDAIYEQGYAMGWDAASAGADTSSSASAWRRRCTCRQRLGVHAVTCRGHLLSEG